MLLLCVPIYIIINSTFHFHAYICHITHLLIYQHSFSFFVSFHLISFVSLRYESCIHTLQLTICFSSSALLPLLFLRFLLIPLLPCYCIGLLPHLLLSIHLLFVLPRLIQKYDNSSKEDVYKICCLL